MKTILKAVVCCSLCFAHESQCRIIDTIVNCGTHKLHFNIIEGNGIPILFEAGGGNDGTVWSSILKPIAEITGTVLITYDRAGFGKSTIDTTDTNVSHHGITRAVDDLENGLQQLCFNKEIVLVAHSFGGYLSKLYSVRHPDKVKSIVLIDVNHNFVNNRWAKKTTTRGTEHKKQKEFSPGPFYMDLTMLETVAIAGNLAIPPHIPVVDLINEIPMFKEKEKNDLWKECHKNFIKSHSKSIGITAYGCDHYIWNCNPDLVILTIANSYAETLGEPQKTEVYQRALQYSIIATNKMALPTKKNYHQ